ncbi:hypothetical protein CONLIGDRAFT_688027 [Coniochaeta ligniaria NRRL 30616]|uniref:Amidoligase enzyme n=1 Tax=Coniochaeta ligniaria NRRL 30616 TaxID=1408157 RepID=A0A1J7K2A9_9PEZI|nr:hypothetical protein CONLIGDRAFT_688027 [Coniochaeta ligniaria NRRL 30616]
MHWSFPDEEWHGEDYTEWEFKLDETIKIQEYDERTHCNRRGAHIAGVELDASQEWRGDITNAFESVTTFCKIKTNKTCSTHIHISPGDGKDWTLDELKEISMAVTYFEWAFLALLPPHRRKSAFCQSHTAGRSWAKADRKEARKLTRLMNPDPRNGNTSTKDYAWHFGNIFPGPSGMESTGKTIEWRQPPGVETADACLAWTELALNFIQAARKPGMHNTIDHYKPNVGGLRKFIKDGLVKGVGSRKYMDSILQKIDKSECKTPTLATVPTSSK